MNASFGLSKSASAPSLVHHDLSHMGHDPYLVNKLMTKRNLELKYRAAIRDPKTRGRGADHTALAAQIEAKKAAATKERQDDLRYDAQRVAADQVLQVCEQIRNEATRERQKLTMQYSLANHRKETRREYSLSDPKQLKNELPIRMGDDDPRLGPSSFQIFEGEERGEKGAQKKAKHAAQRDWLASQIAEKKAIADDLKRQDQLLDEDAARANEIRGICEVQTAQEQIEEKKLEAQENLMIAQQHKARRQAQRDREAAMTQMHVDTQRSDVRMTETIDYQLGVDGRLMKGEYKRLSLEDEGAVYAQNAQIILEKQARIRAEKAEDLAEQQRNIDADSVLAALENHKSKTNIALRKKMEEENKVLLEHRNSVRDAIKKTETIGIFGVPPTNTETKPFMVSASTYF